ncbi:hypothetical protein ABZ085_14785 [Streptomyces albidoflavus]|uniref:hypothetical protein n=1 Tax=Streptomyces albidoflavus TaxID=1886 RepID=UPI0033AD6099
MTSTATEPDLAHGGLAAVIGPVSLLGVALGFAAVPFVMILGLISGAIAVVYGTVGLAKGERRSRGRCLVEQVVVVGEGELLAGRVGVTRLVVHRLPPGTALGEGWVRA